jgi:hypothetical protein
MKSYFCLDGDFHGKFHFYHNRQSGRQHLFEANFLW